MPLNVSLPTTRLDGDANHTAGHNATNTALNATAAKVDQLDTAVAAKADTSSLAAVATTGAYTDLTGRPTIPAAYTDEQAQDAAAALVVAGTHSGISFAYDDAAAALSATVTGGGSAPTITGADEGRTLAVVGGAYALTADPGRLPLKRFRQALAANMTTPLVWWALGDSITEATGATKIDQGYVYQLLRGLQKQSTAVGRGGFGWLGTYWTSFSGSAGSDNYWTFSGGGSNGSASTPFSGKRRTFAAGETATLTFTGTSFKIHHRQGDASSIPFTVTVDGGAPTTVTPTTTGGANTRGIYTSGALTRGVHTVDIAPVSGANTVYIYGATLFDGDETSGIRVYNDGYFGQTSTQFLAGIGASFADAQAVSGDPALVTIHLGTNDYSTGVSPSTTASNLTSIIANVKTSCTVTPSFLLIVPSQKFVASPANPWTDYIAALAGVAAADPTNVALLNLTDHFIDVPTAGNSYTRALLNSDQTHPTDAGHRFIAQLALRKLLGSSVAILDTGEATTAELTAKADDTAVVHLTGAETVAGVKTFSSLPVIPTTTPTTNGQAASKLYVDTVAAGITAGGVSDATTSVKGIVQLAGDLAGTAAAPTVPGLANKLDTSSAPELIRDTIATALVAGSGMTITPNDGADTITLASSGSSGGITGTAAELLTLGWASPAANGFKLWTAPPAMGSVTTSPSPGWTYFVRIFVPVTTTISALSVYVGTAGTGVSNSYLGLFDSSGALLSGSGDVSTSLQSVGLVTGTLSSAQTITGGAGVFVWGALLVGAGSSLALLRHTATTAYVNIGTTAATSNAARSSTGSATALPSSHTPSSLVQSNGIAFWVGAA